MQYIPCNSALLAQKTLFLTQKGTVFQIYKSFGIWEDPPPCWEKFPNNIVFFMRAYLMLLHSAPAQITATCNLQLSISCGILSTLQSFHGVGTRKLEAYLGGQFKRFNSILAQNQNMRKTSKKKLFTPSATPEILEEVQT